jgi:uracil-DNA glycosylase
MNYQDNVILEELLPNNWLKYIDKAILHKVNEALKLEIKQNIKSCIFPYNISDIFKIFHLCELKDIKVVILGQDPYYSNKYQANGIAFSVNKNVKIPPSLRNIYKEAKKESTSGDLSEWVKQGVFLLNASLTVKEKCPNSHIFIWKEFINHIIDIINKECDNIIFVSWGASAASKYIYINLNKHKILSSSHPSPLSCYKTDKPFIGSDIFTNINKSLELYNKNVILW